VPLVTSLVLTKGSPHGLLFVVAAVAAFLLHEPLVLTLGHRGVRAREHAGTSARLWVWLWSAVLLLAGGGVVLLLEERWWMAALPALPAAVLFEAAVRGAEKSARAEVAAAIGFAATAAPVLSLGGAPARWIWVVPVVLGANGALSTLSVRALVAQARANADPHAVLPAKMAALLATAVTVAFGLAALLTDLIDPWIFLALCPAGVAACALSLWPPRAQRLRAVGWTLAAGSLLTASLLVFGLHRG